MAVIFPSKPVVEEVELVGAAIEEVELVMAGAAKLNEKGAEAGAAGLAPKDAAGAAIEEVELVMAGAAIEEEKLEAPKVAEKLKGAASAAGLTKEAAGLTAAGLEPNEKPANDDM